MANGRVRGEGETAARILDSAEGLVQVRGFNGFSYADVAAELDVTKASLHYHFPGKAELGLALIGRYASRFLAALDEIDSGTADPPARLRAYSELYANVLRAQRMCLCGMLAAEYQTLPESMRDAVVAFFDANETWVAGVLADGHGDGTIAFSGDPREAARLIVSALEGAMLVARSYGDVERFETAAERLLAAFATAS